MFFEAKRCLFCIALVLLSGFSPAFANSFGPVKPTAKPGRISQEIGVSHFIGEWSGNDETFDDTTVEQNRIHVQAGYGFDGNWEAYLRAGVADVELQEGFSVDDSGMQDDLKPFASLGVKGLFFRSKNFHVGAFAQASLYSDYKDRKTVELIPGQLVKEELLLKDFWDASAGIAFQVEKGGFDLYFGPMFYVSRATLEAEATILSLNTKETFSTDYQEKEYIGSFFGLSIPVSTYGEIVFEGQYESRLSLGTSYVFFRFDY